MYVQCTLYTHFFECIKSESRVLEQREYNNNAHAIRSTGIHRMAHIPKRKHWHLCIRRRFALVLMKSDDDAEKKREEQASTSASESEREKQQMPKSCMPVQKAIASQSACSI